MYSLLESPQIFDWPNPIHTVYYRPNVCYQLSVFSSRIARGIERRMQQVGDCDDRWRLHLAVCVHRYIPADAITYIPVYSLFASLLHITSASKGYGKL